MDNPLRPQQQSTPALDDVVVVKEKKGEDTAAKPETQTESSTWHDSLFGIFTKGPVTALMAEQAWKLRSKDHHSRSYCLRTFKNRRPYCYRGAYFCDLLILLTFILLSLGVVALVVFFGFNKMIGK